MAPRCAELLFLHLTPRLYILRALIASSIIIVSINVSWIIWLSSPPTKWIILFAFIPIHHILSVFRWKFFYEPIDFALLVVEVIGAGQYAKFLRIRSWIPETLALHVVLAWIIVICLSITISYRIAEAIQTRGKSLIAPFDILANSPPNQRIQENRPFYLLLGRSIWRQNFVGEIAIVRGIRGVLAIIILAAILFFILLKVIFAPVKETALSPVKDFRIPGITPYDLLNDIYNATWNVVYPIGLQVPLDSNNHDPMLLISSTEFFSAVNVTAIWPNYLDSSVTPECTSKVENSRQGPVYLYRCEAAWVDNLFYLPDLQIDVDFGALAPGLSSLVNLSPKINLPLSIGLVDTIEDVIVRVTPTVLIPGVNMAASVVLDIRQIYASGVLAALGMFEITKTFWLPRFVNWYPDPSAPFTGNNLSSLRIFWQDNYGELRLTQDYRENSVVAGFSSVGGLWTAFSGIFTIIFGASMLHTLYGSKPLSIFGLAHSFQSQQMKEECLRLYPNIRDEHDTPEKRGLVSLLRDHLIDLSFLDDKPRESFEGTESGEGGGEQRDVEAAPTVLNYDKEMKDNSTGDKIEVNTLDS